MSEHDDHTFNSTRVFVTLLILTALEVGLSLIWNATTKPESWKLIYWAGLGGFAFWKGLLIYMYFMHMKFEGWIVKGLVAPTPILVIIVLAALNPDIVHNSKLVAPLGSMKDAETGEIEPMNDEGYPKHHGGGESEGHGSSGH